jgi:hypothetical protein
MRQLLYWAGWATGVPATGTEDCRNGTRCGPDCRTNTRASHTSPPSTNPVARAPTHPQNAVTDPYDPELMSEEVRQRIKAGEQVPVGSMKIPMVDLPLGATGGAGQCGAGFDGLWRVNTTGVTQVS